MIEIIPNWHPVFVHFTVGLLSLSVMLYVVSPFLKSSLKEQWLIVAQWSLWFGVAFTVATGLTGLYAYNTVAHDTPSHIAMTDHRNWAIATIVAFLSLAMWSIIRKRQQQKPASLFLVLMVVAGVLLSSTAWRGGEIVYRYGLGVMSLPKAEGDGHDHEHADGEGHGHNTDEKTEMVKDDHHDEKPHGHTDNIDPPEEEKNADSVVQESVKSAEKSTKTHHDDGHDHEH